MSLVIESTKPGVTAVVNQGQVARPFTRQPSSTAFAIGFAPWGPVGVRKLVASWSEFLRTYGGFHALGWIAELAYVYFNHFGGKQMMLVRAAGSSAVVSTVTRNNRAGTPAATFKFDAKYPSSTVDISVTVADTSDTDRCDISISSDALGIVETYKGADLRDDLERTAINAASRLVLISLVAETVSGPTGRPAAGTFALTGGTDDTSGYDLEDLADYLSQFADENLGGGQVLIPGQYDPANVAALTAHAEQYNRLAILDHELAADYQDVAADMNDTPSSHAAAYFPWVEMPPLAGQDRKFFPPSIFAAGACARVDRTIGTHKAPANIKVPNAIDVERNVDGTSVINDGVREFLNGKNINVIAPIEGEGIKIYGARVLAEAGETRIKFVHERRMLNLIYYTAKIGYRWAVFAVVDGAGRLFRDLRASGQNFLRSLWQSGGLYGRTEEEAFIVVADETNNPPDDLAEGRVHVQIGVKLSPTAEQIFVNIDNVPLGQDLNILTGGDA